MWRGDRVHKTQLLLGKGLTAGPEIWIAIPSQKLGNNICIDWCLSFFLWPALFPSAWMFWQCPIFSSSFFPPLPACSFLHTNKTHQQPLALDPHILRSCTWEQNPSVLSSISSCTEKDPPSFRAPWAWRCCTLRSWMSKITVKWGLFLCLLVYVHIYLTCSSQLCPLHEAILEERQMQSLRRLLVMLVELAPEPGLGEWCNLSPPSSTWKIAFRAITLAFFMCLKFQNDENKENK